MAFVYAYFFSDFLCFDMSLLLLTVTLRGVSNKHCLLSFFSFDLMLYVHSKQLRSCWDGELPNCTVPGQASRRQFTSIKCPFFRQLALLNSAEEGNYFYL